MRLLVIYTIAGVAWLALGVVLVATLHGCGTGKPKPITFMASEGLRAAEVRCGRKATAEPTIAQLAAVRCSRDGYVCCLPYDNRFSSYYHSDTNTIDLVSDTQPPQCAEYILEHNLPCEMESAVGYQATGVYADRCITPC